jgi:glyoxylase I family protein
MKNEIISGMGFHHIALKVADFEKSLEMYRALGLREVVRWGEGKSEIAMLDVGDGGRIELFANGSDEFAENGKWQHFALCVDNVDEAYARAIAAGFEPLVLPKVVPLESSPEKIAINVAFVKGPDGEQLEFFRQL